MATAPDQAADPIALSSRLAEKRGREDAGWEALAALPPRALSRALKADSEKLAFWINVYNAAVHRQLLDDPDRYRHRGWFFVRPSVTVAGKRLSLNAIEHGLLRRSMFGYSMGYIANPFPSRFERRFRVERRDFRIHFAVNCGARSCPAVATYDPEHIDEQLKDAAHAYLTAEARYDPGANTVYTPRLLLWFKGDFGGTGGVLELLRHHGVIPDGVSPRIKHQEYDWSLALDP